MLARILLVVILGVAAACAPGEDGPPGEAAGAEVSVSGFAFQPEALTVDRGATVTWANADDVPHTATAADGSFDVALSPGTSGEHTFGEAGTYAYACSLHPQMTGEVEVG